MEGDSRENNIKSIIVTKCYEYIEEKKTTLTLIIGLGQVSAGDIVGMDSFMYHKNLPPTGEITEQQLTFLILVLSQICLEQLSA